jgi:hypothetical protein
MNTNELDLNLNGDTFNALKTDFNAVLRKTLFNMEAKGSELAEITVKMKISLEKGTGRFGDAAPRNITVPKFDHKVSSVMQIKDEIAGSLGGNYELVWDSKRGEWIMREITDGQQSIFDSDYEWVEPDDQPVQTVSGLLPEAVEESDYEYDEPIKDGNIE